LKFDRNPFDVSFFFRVVLSIIDFIKAYMAVGYVRVVCICVKFLAGKECRVVTYFA
jgi:hypothetical protein